MNGDFILSGRTMLPELLRSCPWVRPVLDRYGLRGCGGPEGPVESIEFFARSHDIEVNQLLGELRTAIALPKAPSAEVVSLADNDLADTIYRPFFKAGIAVILSLGAVWGAILLLRIGLHGSFTAVGLHEVNAHGHAQIFGWVGMFVMGFAYQAFPRFKHTTLSHPRWARASLWLMLSGLVVRAVLEPVADGVPGLIPFAVAASVLEIVAVAIFLYVIIATWRASGKTLAIYDYYVLCALGWFAIQTIYDSIYLAATLLATDRQELLNLVATWQAPLREIQIHGFALLMILGVSQRVFHNFYGLPAPNGRLSLAVLFALNLAVLGEVAGLLLMRSAGYGWVPLWYGAVLLLAGAAFVLVKNWRIFGAAEFPDRSLKFLRTAYVWLFISLGMLVLLPAYQFALLPWAAPHSSAAQMGFSHAYYGAIRHAITVGFVSLMIVGVAAKVVPTLNGVGVQRLTRLWGPYILINLGCTMRVAGQITTDFAAAAFPVTAISGLLEVTGLAWWGVHLWLVMAGRITGDESTTDQSHRLGQPIEACDRVGEVLRAYPELLYTFVSFGFTPLRNPVARKLFANLVTIGQACRLIGADVETLLAALNRAITPSPVRRMPLPMLADRSSAETKNCPVTVS